MKRVLVTGGCGFIGSHLVDLLINTTDNFVDVLDDHSTGRASNLSSCITHRLAIIHGSARNRDVVDSIVKNVDVVYHLAASVGVKRVLDAPLHTLQNNIEATANVLTACSKHDKPVLIASSSEVYGNSPHPSLEESHDLHIGPDPRWGYAAAKLVDEFTALAYYKSHRLPVVICRLFNTIGPRQAAQFGMVVPTFIDKALKGEPIVVYGTGKQRRAFAWVGDTVRAMVDLMKVPAAYGEVFNIGSPFSASITDLARWVKKLCDSPSEIVYLDTATAYGASFKEIDNRVPALNKLRSLINYHPGMEIDDMIIKILNGRKYHV